MNVIGQFKDEVEETAGEVVKDFKDSVGQALEHGVQSIAGTQLTPQQIQQRKAEDQKKIAETRRKIAFYQRTAEEQKIVRRENKQKEMQRFQNLKQEEQEKKIEKAQMQQTPKRPGMSEAVRSAQAEYKPSKVGG